MAGKISQKKGMMMGKNCANKGTVALAKGGKVAAGKEVKVKHVVAAKKGGKVK